MNKLAYAAVAYLATRRITSLVVDDYITEDARDAFLKRFPADETKVGYLATCRNCSSVWAAAVTICLLPLTKYFGVRLVLQSLALSEASIITDRVLSQYDKDTFNI